MSSFYGNSGGGSSGESSGFSIDIVNTDNPLPNFDYKNGESWRVTESGEYAGQQCEIGDLIICVSNFEETYKDSDFIVVQGNLDGAVVSNVVEETEVENNLAMFNDDSGKVIADSGIALESIKNAIANSHTHNNKDALDSYTKDMDTLVSDILEEAVAAWTKF
jgi:predicted RNA-binding protein YlqC (UPF0109 family)